MTWEETILHIRNDESFKESVHSAYLGENILDSIERYRKSEEFQETLKCIKRYLGEELLDVIDVGAGNGITTIALALEGYNVTAIEPDPSEIIGANVIKNVAKELKLNNVSVVVDKCENIDISSKADLVISRQAMHHAQDLKKYVLNMARFLKDGGMVFTIRDHVVFNDIDFKMFLHNHPLHRFYGGENAYSLEEYRSAFQAANLKVKEQFSYFENVLNFFPRKEEDFKKIISKYEVDLENSQKKYLGFFRKVGFLQNIFVKAFEKKYPRPLNEIDYPGRPYSFIATKDKVDSSLAPIVFFAFNRPEHTIRALNSIKNCKESRNSRLFVYCDGPRNKESLKEVKETIEIVEKLDWCCEVKVYKNKSNNGLANQIVRGVSEVVNDYGKVIVMEDDLEISTGFLDFMNKGLIKYESTENVYSICGYLFPMDQSIEKPFFSRLVSSWGWATWKRAWDSYDHDLKTLSKYIDTEELEKQFNLDGCYNFSNQISLNLREVKNTWGIRWYLSVFKENGLSLFPNKSLLKNRGFDGSGVNCNSENEFYSDDIATSVIIPDQKIEEDIKIREKIKDYFSKFQT